MKKNKSYKDLGFKDEADFWDTVYKKNWSEEKINKYYDELKNKVLMLAYGKNNKSNKRKKEV